MQVSESSQPNKERFLGESLEFNYKMLIGVCKFTTLYLLRKYNERDYLFEDPLERKYRVKIGATIACTCHQGNLGHCIHSLFVLVRICKMPQNHPYLFLKSYTQQQLTTIEQFAAKSEIKVHKKVTQIIANSEEIERMKEQVSSLVIGKDEQDKQKQVNTSEEKWPVFDQDTVCSICYDQIENKSPIINCLSCKNYFHTKCLKIWVIQQKQDNPQTSCPMCRSRLQQHISDRIQQMNKFYIKYHQSHGIDCSNCKKDILIKLYKCLLCQEFYLCAECYTKWEHRSHDRFVGRDGKNADWGVCCRSEYNINKLNGNLQYMRKCGQLGVKSPEFKQLMGEKYDQFMNSYIKKPTLKEHIIESLLDVEKEVHKTYKKLDFSEQDIVCCVCRKKKIVGMRRMTCKHFIDQKCLKLLLENKVRQCPIDKKYILPGLSGVQVKIQ